jgi:radical SAM protein (TIGR01212 family)
MDRSPEPLLPFTDYAEYLRARYGKAVRRIAVDGGFSCPHRSRDRRSGGCFFCAAGGNRSWYQADWFAQGSGADALGESRADEVPLAAVEKALEAQVRHACGRTWKVSSGSERLIIFFQSYSGTYGPVGRLKSIYDYALSLADFVELDVATRPDCVSPEVADLLASYRPRLGDVWVELGLQSAQGETLRAMNRGHGVEDFAKAHALLRSRGIKVAAHMILGLPGESREDMVESARYLASLGIDGVKFHDLQIPRSSALYRDFLKGEHTLLPRRAYAEVLAESISVLPKSCLIMRMNCELDDADRALPRSLMDKAAFRRELISLCHYKKLWQGKGFQASPGAQARM